jgi:hypothetical protein
MEKKYTGVYDLIATYRNKWISEERAALEENDYQKAQSYKDMVCAARILLRELEQEDLA